MRTTSIYFFNFNCISLALDLVFCSLLNVIQKYIDFYNCSCCYFNTPICDRFLGFNRRKILSRIVNFTGFKQPNCSNLFSFNFKIFLNCIYKKKNAFLKM